MYNFGQPVKKKPKEKKRVMEGCCYFTDGLANGLGCILWHLVFFE